MNATTRWLLLAWLCVAGPALRTDGQTTQPATPTRLPHVRVNLQQRLVDLEAQVALREGDWVELLACTPGTREYESVLSCPAKPSHIHLALVMLGLEPGTPLTWRRDGDDFKVSPPEGPRVAVSIVVENDDEAKEIPANEFFVHQRTGKPMPDNIWLFVGSGFAEVEDQRVYRADINGSILSTVNFGDEVLARQTELTNTTDEGAWGPQAKMIPPVGTKVTIRLRPAPPPAATQPANR